MNDGAIIRPAKGQPYTVLPNTLLRDRRLSADTRTMVALILSKPKGWRIRPPALAKELAHESVGQLGREKMARMFREATAAGYMARYQTRQDSGLWGAFAYLVGMPEDVKAAVDVIESNGFSAVEPEAGKPQAAEPQAAEPQAVNPHAYKGNNLKNNESIKPLSKVSPTAAQACLPEEGLGEEALTLFGRAAQDGGCRFVWEGSKAAIAWNAFRGLDGMPPVDEAIVGGERRRGFWLPSLFPPKRLSVGAGE